MRSKSEVIVANALRSLGIDYSYEELLRMPDGSVREPDFTIRRSGQPPIYGDVVKNLSGRPWGRISASVPAGTSRASRATGSSRP
jgi:hypothetical protein